MSSMIQYFCSGSIGSNNTESQASAARYFADSNSRRRVRSAGNSFRVGMGLGQAT
jgi:hypothetical protein